MNPLSFQLCRTSVWLAGCRLGPSLWEGLLSERPLRRALGAAPLSPLVTSLLVQEVAQNKGPKQNKKLFPLRRTFMLRPEH